MSSNELGKKVEAWVDSTQTSITRSEGTWDAAARTMDDPRGLSKEIVTRGGGTRCPS